MTHDVGENSLKKERTSVLLTRILADLSDEKVLLGALMLQLRHRSFGGVFIFLSLLSLLPGVTIFTGPIAIILAIQLMLGFKAPLLPRVLRERSINIISLKAIAEKTIPWIIKIEKLVKPRWLIVTGPAVTKLVGLLVISLAVLVTLPLPFSNFLPAISIFFLAFGLLERDGLLLVIGMFISAIALLIGFLMVYLFIETIMS
tara:strand:- start:398 stop:1003 length:606 start_codon:yes stop_codon:yes gene_type:complete